MKVTVFSTKNFDKLYLGQSNAWAKQHHLTYLETALDKHTVFGAECSDAVAYV